MKPNDEPFSPYHYRLYRGMQSRLRDEYGIHVSLGLLREMVAWCEGFNLERYTCIDLERMIRAWLLRGKRDQ